MHIVRDFSELDCLRRLRLNDEQAFDALFRHYGPLVYRFAYGYLKAQPEAEEIVQDCFLKVWEKRATLLDDVPLRGYLFTLAHHAILNQLRQQRHQQRFRAYSAALAPAHAANGASFAELESVYRNALDQLPPKRRQIFELSRRQGLSYPEIARQLNLSVKTVEAQMSHALRFMRGYFQAHGEGAVCLALLLALASA